MRNKIIGHTTPLCAPYLLIEASTAGLSIVSDIYIYHAGLLERSTSKYHECLQLSSRLLLAQ